MRAGVVMEEVAYGFPAVWTEVDLETLPDDGHRYEILDADLIMTPPASYEHQSIGRNLLRILLNELSTDDWDVHYEMGVRVPSGNFVPDIVVLHAGLGRPGLWQEPDAVGLVVEIASKSTVDIDNGIKRGRYATAGIETYWQIAFDGTVTAHSDIDNGQYTASTIAKPGAVWQVERPFELRFDPARLGP